MVCSQKLKNKMKYVYSIKHFNLQNNEYDGILNQTLPQNKK